MDARIAYQLKLAEAELDRAEKAGRAMSLYLAADAARFFVNTVRELLNVEGHGEPSSPGQAPHKQTGYLQDNVEIIEFSGGGGQASVTVAASARYAAFLEYGTRKMLARPFMAKARRAVQDFLTTLSDVELERQWTAFLEQTNPDYAPEQIMNRRQESRLRRRTKLSYLYSHVTPRLFGSGSRKT